MSAGEEGECYVHTYVSFSLQLFDELLEQLRDTALKSVDRDVSVCPQVLFLLHMTTSCSCLFTTDCGMCGQVDQLVPPCVGSLISMTNSPAQLP